MDTAPSLTDMDEAQLSEHVKILTCELQSLYRRNDELRRLALRCPHRAQEAAQEAAEMLPRIDDILREAEAAKALLERLTAPTN